MSIPGAASPLFLATTGAAGAFEISRSLRFNSGDSAYLNRTPSAAGNLKTWTWSAWVKRSGLGASTTLFESRSGSSDTTMMKLYFDSSDQLWVVNYSYFPLKTTQVFRDTSAWYHIVWVLDVTQSTSSNKMKLYVNGIEITSFATDSRGALGTNDQAINRAQGHWIGAQQGTADYFNGYLAEVNFIDGQALAPTDFGETDDNGVWQAKEFTGTYGWFNNSRAWSDSSVTTFTNAFSLSSFPPSLLFNGNITDGVPSAESGDFVISFSTAVTVASSVLILVTDGSVSSVTFDSNSASNTSGDKWEASFSGTFSTITIVGSNNRYVKAIYIDGKLLIDSSVSVADNSFRLPFTDNSGATATTLGKDTSGNGNNFTPNNFSAAAPTASYSSAQGSNITTTEAAKVFDTDDSDYGVATGDLIGFAYSGNSVEMKIQNIDTTQTTLNFYIQPFVSGGATNSGSWSNPSVGTVNANVWSIPANSTGTATFTFPSGYDGVGRFYLGGWSSSFRMYSMKAGPAEGSAIDSLVDTPTNGDTASDNGAGGEITGNYATFNPLRDDRSGYNEAPTNGNLETNPRGDFVSTIPVKSGKYYWEITIDTQGSPGQSYIGIVDQDQISTGGSRGWGTSQIAAIRNVGSFYGDGSTGTAVTFAAGDILGFALDADNNKLWISKNGTYVNSGNPAGGTGHAFSGLSFSAYLFIVSDSNTGNKYILNAGQRAYNTAAPTGFKTWCTTNLPTPTIADGSLYFDTKLYTSTGADLSVTGLQFSPDFVWVKNRQTANRHAQFDIVRGPNKYISSTRTNAEITTSGSGYGTGTFNSFDANGFTLGNDVGANVTNYPSGDGHVAWAWDGGTSTVSNTDGSITSNVRAQPSAGFSIVSYTGTGSSATVGHSLNVAPAIYIIKSRSASTNWQVSTTAIDGSHDYLILNSTGAKQDSGRTAPTSSVFSTGSGSDLNGSGSTYIAYCFAPVEGYSAMGSYEGNSNANGPFIYTGMRPSWILVKNVDTGDSSADWFIYDTKRSAFNAVDDQLYPNRNIVEAASSTHAFDILSNGFKVRSSSTSGLSNKSGDTYIYLAFASNPFASNGGLAR